MTSPHPGHVDPVVRSATIGRDEKIATMGSCFAQNLARHLHASGLNYFVPEQAPEGMSAEVARNRNFGIFSARYGNVYTVRQALQLFDRAFGAFRPEIEVWEKDGKFVDAFRPRIEPDGFSSIAELKDSSARHLRCVRDVFTRSNWFVFTLGLTEAWRSTSDGAVYPLAPGVAGGTFDLRRYEFVNFTAGEVREDLAAFVERVRRVNPRAKLLLTVSPVPLIATYEKRHVWVSTTFSKAALRVAADEIERRFEDVFYFPAYEIITSPAAGGRYYDDDLRRVTELGVGHVMRVFRRHFFPKTGEASHVPESNGPVFSLQDTDDVVCDEEVIAIALKKSGFNPG